MLEAPAGDRSRSDVGVGVQSDPRQGTASSSPLGGSASRTDISRSLDVVSPWRTDTGATINSNRSSPPQLPHSGGEQQADESKNPRAIHQRSPSTPRPASPLSSGSVDVGTPPFVLSFHSCSVNCLSVEFLKVDQVLARGIMKSFGRSILYAPAHVPQGTEVSVPRERALSNVGGLDLHNIGSRSLPVFPLGIPLGYGFGFPVSSFASGEPVSRSLLQPIGLRASGTRGHVSEVKRGGGETHGDGGHGKSGHDDHDHFNLSHNSPIMAYFLVSFHSVFEGIALGTQGQFPATVDNILAN